jgi:2-hydroxy-3-oxopropionate reductase
MPELPGHQPPRTAEVLLLGTGIMGTPMAINLHRAGFRVTAWNRSGAKLAPLAAAGLPTVQSIDQLPHSQRTVIVMLSTGEVVDSVLFGAGEQRGVIDVLARGSVVVVMSSIPMSAAVLQAARLAERGIDYVDAPVSGGQLAAQSGALSIMAGGDQALIDRIAPLLGPLGRVTRVGPTGSGCLAKLANQLIVGVTIGAVAEALVLAEAGGADPAAVRTALLGGFADSAILRQHGERMISRRFEPGAHATTQLKDLRTARELADSLAASLPMLSLCESMYRAMCETEMRSLDHSALYLTCRARAGLTA